MIKVKVIKSSLPTYWYSNQIGKTFFADEKVKNRSISKMAEGGFEYRELFKVNDIEVVEGKLEY